MIATSSNGISAPLWSGFQISLPFSSFLILNARYSCSFAIYFSFGIYNCTFPYHTRCRPFFVRFVS